MKAPSDIPSVIVVMGVSGSGKSTVASMLAHRLHWTYEDGDWFHPEANVEKMHHGEPLTDEDRRPWLRAQSNSCLRRDWFHVLRPPSRYSVLPLIRSKACRG